MAACRRRLPHFHPDGAYLFVAWRLHGSLPATATRPTYPTPGHAFAAEERLLNQSPDRLWMRDPRIARQVMETIRTGESQQHLSEFQSGS